MLIEFEGLPESLPELRRPGDARAFEGWNDAGDAASGAVVHLEDVWAATPAGGARPRGLLRLPGQPARRSSSSDGERRGSPGRPPGSRSRASRWPRPRRRAGPRHRALDALAHASPPSCSAVARDLGVEMVVTLGALLADIPHTRPIPVSGTVERRRPRAQRSGFEPSPYEGPTGIVGVLQDACARGRHPRGVAVGGGAALRRAAAVPQGHPGAAAPGRGPARRRRCRSATCPRRRGPGSAASTSWPSEDDEIARVRRASSRRPATPPTCRRPAATRSRASSSATCAAATASPRSPPDSPADVRPAAAAASAEHAARD